MVKRTSIEERQLFYRDHLAGKSYPRIATETGYSQACVRYWCRRQWDGGKIETKYQRPKQAILSRFDPRVRYAILRLRLKHPRWGPNRIVFHLRKRTSVRHLRLPSETQIGRYLHQWERFRRKTRPELKRPRPQQPTEVHQRWQLDFKMGIALESGELVNLHTVCDPVGEACLGAQVFPAGRVGSGPHKIKFEQVQATLCYCFAHWKTLPQEIQTDGETDLVAERRTNDFPKPFTLWLKGLGIAHLVIRPGRPTDQAEVERCHRTINDYAIIGNESTDLSTLQAILNQAVVELARELPSQAPGCSGQPPGQAHPELLQPGLTFSPEWEWAVFDLQNVDQHLAALCWTRKVNKSGQVKVAAKRYYIGRIYAGQEVEVRFDPATDISCFPIFSRPMSNSKDNRSRVSPKPI